MADGDGIAACLEAGLRAAGLRRAVIAGNLANLNTPGFRRRAVAFETCLGEALASGGSAAGVEPVSYEPRSTPVNAKGNDVDLDLEIGEMVRNDVRYKTYLRVLSKFYQQMETPDAEAPEGCGAGFE